MMEAWMHNWMNGSLYAGAPLLWPTSTKIQWSYAQSFGELILSAVPSSKCLGEHFAMKMCVCVINANGLDWIVLYWNVPTPTISTWTNFKWFFVLFCFVLWLFQLIFSSMENSNRTLNLNTIFDLICIYSSLSQNVFSISLCVLCIPWDELFKQLPMEKSSEKANNSLNLSTKNFAKING